MSYETQARPLPPSERTPVRAAIYIRVSTKPQAGEDKISIPDQLRECRKFVTTNKWVVAGEFIDPGISANSITRPGLQGLLASVANWDVVLAWDFDRFYRDKRSVAGFILDTLDEHRKQITSVKQPIPIYDPASYDPRENDTPYMLREMAGFTSGIDNRRRFRTLQKGLKERFAQGFMIKPPPYGYRIALAVENGRVIRLPRQIVPEEAAVVRRMYKAYLSGQSYHGIALVLNAERIPSRNKEYWSANVVRGVLRNPTYCGMVYRNCRKVGQRSKMLPESQWEILRGKHEPIVTEDFWRQAQEIRKRKQKRARALGTPLLLSGLLRCGHCGSGMCKDGSWGGGYYICGKYKQTGHCTRNGYRRTTLEADVTRYLIELFRNETIFDRVAAAQQSAEGAELRTEIERLAKLHADLPTRKARLFELYEKEDISRKEFAERNAEHNAMDERLQSVLKEKRDALARLEAARMDRATFEEALRSFDSHWDTADVTVRKHALAGLIDRIQLIDGSFSIHFRTGTSTL